MEYVKRGNVIILRLVKGEEIVDALLTLADREGIGVASVTGLGAANDITVGVLRTADKKYVPRVIREDTEIVSLVGNLTRQGASPYVHIHGAFSTESGATVGGHINRAVVSATAELFVTVYEGTVGRRFDTETGLNLFDFGGNA